MRMRGGVETICSGWNVTQMGEDVNKMDVNAYARRLAIGKGLFLTLICLNGRECDAREESLRNEETE